ncbi:coiled-coil domain-containing protein CG32809 isoform X4 [Plutella xylostella]|uniref:coiled-coil domain-containing protein CG32809 isoform X4 n=1 Tax=Plutella xylostella TaxID=51655 RepID=UPI0020329A99|nr:coiled-coil domain-containing protein CG32809 isoform X4 [Plutella xylostella]
MAEIHRKRMGSFKKYLPSIFFKSKDKQNTKELPAKSRDNRPLSSNQYEYPPCLNQGNASTNARDNTSERIYENLTVLKESVELNLDNEHQSQNSSSSTLVNSIETNTNDTIAYQYSTREDSNISHLARPQVPPKPQHENLTSHLTLVKQGTSSTEYPDVYYHSVETIPDKIKIDENKLHRYNASSSRAHPASVGAEIKKVSTTFLISPKKEAEVRTIQPNRARSLSLDKEKSRAKKNLQSHQNENVQRTYNYSAPTSPIPVNHKIPKMPATVSPYGSVRNTMSQAGEMQNTQKLTTKFEPKSIQSSENKSMDGQQSREPIYDSTQKEKNRQNVELFYWQKLKELKIKEDEYLLKQSLNTRTSTPIRQQNVNTENASGVQISGPRSCSLPRGVDSINYKLNKSIYGAPSYGTGQRRQEVLIAKNGKLMEQDVIYRHPEKINGSHIRMRPSIVKNTLDPVYQEGLCEEYTYSSPKRVSFEEQKVSKTYGAIPNNNSHSRTTKRLAVEVPPRPPVRQSSASGNVNRNQQYVKKVLCVNNSIYSESESGSEAGEIQRILQSGRRGGLSDGEASRGARGRPSRRDDPRRHTLAGNHLYLHPHHPGQINSHEMEIYSYENDPYYPEYATVTKHRDHKQNKCLDPRLRKPPLPRGYMPQNAMLFDDDPGIMSEVETASTGFRRGGKQRSSLPVVRTPSKTLERPLGLVFLQYRNETKRALLPNEITSIDTVKALFVRSFPKQLTMQYMDSPMVKIYIHDSSKDMFYELEDVRAHLRDIRDRSVLRLFEAQDIGGVFPGALGVGAISIPAAVSNSSNACSGPPIAWDQDQSYFSEPEVDTEYNQHVHKSKVKAAPAYYMGSSAPSTLPRSSTLLRAFSPATTAPVPADRIKTHTAGGVPGYSGAERARLPRPAPDLPHLLDLSRLHDRSHSFPVHGDNFLASPERNRVPYEDPYYAKFMAGGGVGRPPIAPIIDEEGSDAVALDEQYQLYGVNVAPAAAARGLPRPPFDPRAVMAAPPVDDMQRLRVEKMERQLANLTGLVQKALQVPPAPVAAPVVAPRHELAPTYSTRANNTDGARYSSVDRPPKLGKDKFQKSVSFEKSVSFSDDPPDMNSPKQHSPQHSADTKPAKPAIKSSTLPRTSSQERDRLKPAPPPKPVGLAGQQMTMPPQRTYAINVTPDFFGQMRALQKQAHDLRIETRNMRRSTLNHAIQMRQLIAETIVKIGDLAASMNEDNPESLSREEEIYRQDMLLLENDLYELEATVERLRGQAANSCDKSCDRDHQCSVLETRVNMADIERIAMVLSKSSKTVADWKLKFPLLQETMKIKLSSEMEKVVRKEKLLEEEPERLELALRRCKKLTGTLVTLKRLACVQEQRLPCDGRISPSSSQGSTFYATAAASVEDFDPDANGVHLTINHAKGPGAAGRGAGRDVQRAENALDALLDELQTFAKPGERAVNGAAGVRGGGAGAGGEALRRLHSYPSGSDTDASPPVRARGHHAAKPPVPERHPELLALAGRRAPPPPPPRTTSRSPLPSPTSPPADDPAAAERQLLLEQRHQELLKKQRALQEQYARLQMIQRSGPALPPELKKTGSESNLLSKLSLHLAPAAVSGSMTQLEAPRNGTASPPAPPAAPAAAPAPLPAPVLPASKLPDSTTNKVYETDIL